MNMSGGGEFCDLGASNAVLAEQGFGSRERRTDYADRDFDDTGDKVRESVTGSESLPHTKYKRTTISLLSSQQARPRKM